MFAAVLKLGNMVTNIFMTSSAVNSFITVSWYYLLVLLKSNAGMFSTLYICVSEVINAWYLHDFITFYCLCYLCRSVRFISISTDVSPYVLNFSEVASAITFGLHLLKAATISCRAKPADNVVL